MADKRQVRAGISLAYIKVLDRGSILPVIIFDVPKPLLGVTNDPRGFGDKGRPSHGKS